MALKGNTGIIIIAATKPAPMCSDSALLAPTAVFDRQVVRKGRSRHSGRLSILKGHSRNRKLAEGVSLEAIRRDARQVHGS